MRRDRFDLSVVFGDWHWSDFAIGGGLVLFLVGVHAGWW